MKINIKLLQIHLLTFIAVFCINILKLYLSSKFYLNLDFFAFHFANEVGDTFSYFIPMDNYIKEGSYYAIKHGIKYYAVRPPHYMFLYYFFNVLGYTKTTIYSIMVLLQIALHSLSVILLSNAVSKIFNNKRIYYFCLIFMITSSSISYLNMMIVPESIVISLVSISIYFYSKYIRFKEIRYLVLCTFCIALAVQLRPYIMLGLIIPFATILYYVFLNKSLKRFILESLILILVVLLVIGPWIYRNYKIYNVIAPYDYKILDYYHIVNVENSYLFSKKNFVNSQGEGEVFWDIDCMSSFFEDSTSKFKQNSRFQFTNYNFCRGITMREYEKSRVLYLDVLKHPDDTIKQNDTKEYFNYLTSIYKKEKPFNFYFVSPIKMILKSIFHKGTYYLPFTMEQTNSNYLLKIWKYAEFFLYQILLLSSFIGIFASILNKNKYLILLLFPISCIFTMYLIKGNEYRYFGYSYPILFIFASHGLDIFYLKLYK